MVLGEFQGLQRNFGILEPIRRKQCLLEEGIGESVTV